MKVVKLSTDGDQTTLLGRYKPGPRDRGEVIFEYKQDDLTDRGRAVVVLECRSFAVHSGSSQSGYEPLNFENGSSVIRSSS